MLFLKCFPYLTSIFVISTRVAGLKIEAKMVTASKCDLDASRLNSESPIKYNVTSNKLSRRLTVMNANFSIPYRYGPVSVACRAYQIKANAAKDLVFRLEHISCHNIFMFQLIKLANISFDKDCYFPPGLYKIENLDFNNYKWIISKSVTTTGKYGYELEFSDSKGVFTCVYVVCEVKFL